MSRGRIIYGFIIIVIVLAATAGQASAGEILGVVHYEGPVPEFRTIDLTGIPECNQQHPEGLKQQTLELGARNSLRNVFMYIEGAGLKESYSPPKEPALITIEGCRFKPHVTGAMAGQEIKFMNKDGVLHDINIKSAREQSISESMPAFRETMTKVIENPEAAMHINCDVHGWMNAWLWVMPHPFFDVTHDDGRFRIENVPAGEYTLTAWHEEMGKMEQKISVTSDEKEAVNFVFSYQDGKGAQLKKSQPDHKVPGAN